MANRAVNEILTGSNADIRTRVPLVLYRIAAVNIQLSTGRRGIYALAFRSGYTYSFRLQNIAAQRKVTRLLFIFGTGVT